MSATEITTTRAPKAKPSVKRDRLSQAKAKTHAAVDKLYAAALETSEGFPRLRAVVEKWIVLRREEADLDAAHGVLDASAKANHEAVTAACNEWHAKIAAAEEAALSILDWICIDGRESVAKVATFQAMYGDKPEEFRDFSNAPMAIVASLQLDIEAMQGGVRREAPAGREAWDAAYAAWRAAEAAEAPDDAVADAFGAAAANAHAALIRLPAPDLEAVAAKLSFYGEYTRFNAFLDEEKAREILEGDDWLLECVAAAYLDLRRMIATSQDDRLLLALGAEFERRWAVERDAGRGLPDAEYEAMNAETNRIAAQIMATPAATIPGLRVKARAALWCQTDNENEPFNMGGDRLRVCDATLAGSIVNDLLASPPVAPGPHADAEIIDAAIRFKALSDEFDECGADRKGGPNDADRARYKEISEAKQPLIDLMMATRATTLEGFRAKALVAKWYAPTEDFVEYEDLEWKVHRTLTDDLLATGPAPVHPDAELLELAADFTAKRKAWISALYSVPDYALKEFDENEAPYRQLSDAHYRAYDTLAACRARTPQGLIALTTALRHYQSGDPRPESFDPSEVPPTELMRAVCDSAMALAAGQEAERPAGTDRWEAARALWLTAKNAEDRMDEVLSEAGAALTIAAAPIPVDLLNENGQPYLASDIEDHPEMSPERKARLLRLHGAWLILKNEAGDLAGLQAWDDAAGEANKRTFSAFMAYMQTPPPNLQALLTQVRDAINREVVPRYPMAVDDPGAMDELLAHDNAATNYLSMVYQHLLRMLGEDSPALRGRRDFDPTEAETPVADPDTPFVKFIMAGATQSERVTRARLALRGELEVEA